MEKNIRLVNIYLKIHNKRLLTMDDLSYLAKYDPECFEKTCKNVVYNIPSSKPVVEPRVTLPANTEQKTEMTDRQFVELVLQNLRRLEANEFPVADVDVDEVKSLLGSLYMELLYPHNDKETFIHAPEEEREPLFDKKA